MKYEYTEVSSGPGQTNVLLDDINELGKEGWRLVTYSYTDGGFEAALLERELPEDHA